MLSVTRLHVRMYDYEEGKTALSQNMSLTKQRNFNVHLKYIMYAF